MSSLKTKMKREAFRRLESLVENFGLNPMVIEEYKKGNLFYSYLCGIVGSIDTIHYDERYAKVVEDFEKESGSVVYHVIESYYCGFNMLVLLHVSKYPQDWATQRDFRDGFAFSYVHNFDIPGYSEFGYIEFVSHMGALIRVN